jgi:hypothetical protein
MKIKCFSWIAQRIYDVVNDLEIVNYLLYDMQIHTKLSNNLHNILFFLSKLKKVFRHKVYQKRLKESYKVTLQTQKDK